MHPLPFDMPASGVVTDRIINVSANDTAMRGRMADHIGWYWMSKMGHDCDFFTETVLGAKRTYVQSELHACLISGHNVQESIFKDCNVTGNTISDFKGVHRHSSDWSAVVIEGGDWTSNKFKHCYFNGATLKTDLRGSTFYGCALVNADLRGSLGEDVLFTTGRLPVHESFDKFCISAESKLRTDLSGCKMGLDFALAATFDKVKGMESLEIYDKGRLVTNFGFDSLGRLRPAPESRLQSLARTFAAFTGARKNTVTLDEALAERGIVFGMTAMKVVHTAPARKNG